MIVKSSTRQYIEIEDNIIRKRIDVIMAIALIKNQYIKGEIERDVYENCKKQAQKILADIKGK